MAAANPALPYGLRDLKVRPISAAGVVGTSVDLPAARTLSFEENEDFEELRGDDKVVATRGNGPTVSWDLEAGGISLAALVIIAGGLVTTTGTTPAEVMKLAKKTTDARPYFQIEGRAIGDDAGDVHCIIYKCKAQGPISGEFADGQFFVTAISGIGIGDSSDKLYDFVSNETAVAIT